MNRLQVSRLKDVGNNTLSIMLHRTVLIMCVLFFSGSILGSPIVFAMSQDDINSIVGNTTFYDSCSEHSTTAPSSSPVIVIDPGHSGTDISDTDPQTGLYDHDYPNIPEITEVFSVAQKVQAKLQSDGYTVVMTKTSADQSVSFRQRADIADQANADLAISIHDTHDTSWNNMGGGDGGQIYTQNVGDYRQNKPNMGSGNQKITFTDSTIAAESNQYGAIFATQRTADENHKVEVTHDNFDSRSGLPNGNITEVQLFAKVPWVYNEVGAPSGPLSQSQLDEYAKGLIDGVEKSVPINGTTPSPSSSSGSSTECCPTSSNGSIPTILTGNDNEAKAYNFFLQVGLSPAQSAGIVANLYNESSVNPLAGGSDPNASPAFGIAQWTPGSKFATDMQYLHISGAATDLLAQLQVLWQEINGKGEFGSNIVPGLKKINDPSQAAVYFRDNFEKCDMSRTSCSDRGSVGVAVYNKYANGGAGSGGTGNCQNPTTDCQSASGDAAILCEAEKYKGIYYEWGGGHQGYQAFIAGCPDPSNPPDNHATGGPVNGDTSGLSGNPSPCATDCSGLVSIAVDEAFNQDYMWTVTGGVMVGTGSQYWKRIPISQAQAGDIVTMTEHVEIVDHVSGDTLYTFGSHYTGSQTGGVSAPISAWLAAFHWTGPGS